MKKYSFIFSFKLFMYCKISKRWLLSSIRSIRYTAYVLTVSKSFYQINKSTQNCDTFKFSKKKNKNI